MKPASLALLVVLAPLTALAEAPVERSFSRLSSSNGHTAVLVELPQAKLSHFREHLFATEEPVLDAAGNEVWVGNQPQAVNTRDLLYDAYFGLREGGAQRWLTTVPVDLDASGYAPWTPGAIGGTGVVRWVQRQGALELTSYAFAPRGYDGAAFVMALAVRNTGTATASGVQVFSLHNFHLGYGRPGVNAEIGENGETVEVRSAGAEIAERAFAGVVVTRALGTPRHTAAWNGGSPAAQNGYQLVANGGTADLPDVSGTTATADGWAHAFQFDLGDLAPGQEAWAGVVAAHYGDPFAAAQVEAKLDAFVNGRGPKALVDAEVADWAAFEQKLTLPAGSSADEESVLRQSAVMLAMAQVQDATAFLREHLTKDGEPRRTRFLAPGGGAATLPGVVAHRGKGAVLASLPPGEWTYAWLRDGAYAVAAMAALGMKDEARAALRFYFDAESGRFKDWNELKPYAMPAYLPTLTRYHGFGVEETDFNDFGPNLELDGFGLLLWALGQYERRTGDTAFVDSVWPALSTRVADPLVALVDPATGLVRKDSSIWETHWNGRERSWAYTSLTAARGLCDAAALAERKGDAALAAKYRKAGTDLRAAIAKSLTDQSGALASNLEELQAGSGYFDAAVVEGVALGLFKPTGRIASATLDALDANLRTAAGPGWARNDDRTDHAGADDLSPWGSDYDSAEWAVTDLRGAVAMRLAERPGRAGALASWAVRQARANYGAVAETFDETTGRYKFNAPMAGFGAGALVLTLAERGAAEDPACGAYFDESAPATVRPDAGTLGGDDVGTPATTPANEPESCGCGAGGAGLVGLTALVPWLASRRRRRR